MFFDGSSDTSYEAFDLDGHSTDTNGYFLLGTASLIQTPSIIFPDATLQNGADAVALYLDNATSFPNGTPATATNVVDAIVYDANGADDDPGLLERFPGNPQCNEERGDHFADQSNQLCPNGSNSTAFIQATPTPGAANNCD
ncbi:MAG: hypothetical protein MI923_20160 [Phycisphaerales bacterium]|nr:hypothetical protein [Phycisphaerales bacterium]